MSENNRWSKTISTPKDSKSINVEQIDNGFIVELCTTTHGEDYKYETKKIFSKENPLAEETPEVNKDSLEAFINPPFKIY